MLVSKILVLYFSLCFIHECVSKPTTGNELTESQSIWSKIWNSIKYYFSWTETELPVTEQFEESATANPTDIIDIRRHNVTIWCNDQICTTMKCDKIECRNITCNVYNTDFRGECREYNNLLGPPDYTAPYSTNVTVHIETTEAPSKTSGESKGQPENNPTSDETDLKLEAMSTVDNRSN